MRYPSPRVEKTRTEKSERDRRRKRENWRKKEAEESKSRGREKQTPVRAVTSILFVQPCSAAAAPRMLSRTVSPVFVPPLLSLQAARNPSAASTGSDFLLLLSSVPKEPKESHIALSDRVLSLSSYVVSAVVLLRPKVLPLPPSLLPMKKRMYGPCSGPSQAR